jgi:hypothetical protein
MALVDAIKLNSVLISNGGFETPVLASGQYVFNPTNATPWTFTATTGITRNNSIYTGTVTAAFQLQDLEDNEIGLERAKDKLLNDCPQEKPVPRQPEPRP